MDAVTLTLLGINVGVGFVYYALPVARYRRNLFQAIVDLVSRELIPEKSQANVQKLLQDEPEFRKAYDELAFWLGELPDEQTRQLNVDRAETIMDVVTPGTRPSADGAQKRYYWFKKDYDRRACIIASSVAPIVVLWFAWVFDGSAAWKWFGGVVAIFGQICVVWHVFAGRKMMEVGRDTFEKALDQVVKKLRQRTVDNAVEKGKARLEDAGQSSD